MVEGGAVDGVRAIPFTTRSGRRQVRICDAKDASVRRMETMRESMLELAVVSVHESSEDRSGRLSQFRHGLA
jgi:hypothetical protein